jgi:predicted dehydrogenase
VAVATRSSLSALNACRRFPFERHGTDAQALLRSEDIDAVVIATRHSSHATLVAAGLEAGRTVFVEKPLAIDRAGLERVRQAILTRGNDRLMVGFNRRFAPLVVELREFFSPRTRPLFMSYRVHAGPLESDSWYLREGEGSRFVGEGGHFLDVFAFLTGARPTSVSASCLRPAGLTPDDRDNLAVTVTYDDGSVGSLLYLTQGSRRVPKEYLEVFGSGRTAQLDNFAVLHLFSADRKRTRRARPDKGQSTEMAALVQAVCTGSALPVDVDCLFDTTLATLAVDLSLRRGAPVPIADFWARDEEVGPVGAGATEAQGEANRPE